MSTQLRSVNDTRYTAAAIVLHWAIALAIISNLALAQWMQAALDDAARQAAAVAAFQVHKSIGLTVLALSLARLGLRWIIPPAGHAGGYVHLAAPGGAGHSCLVLSADDRHSPEWLGTGVDAVAQR